MILLVYSNCLGRRELYVLGKRLVIIIFFKEKFFGESGNLCRDYKEFV